MVIHSLVKRFVLPSVKDVFNFMWKKSDNVASPGYFLNTEDFYIRNGVVTPLSQAQKAYRDFVVSNMRKKYEKHMNEIVGANGNLLVTRAQRLGLPAKLPDNFLPRMPKTMTEIRQDQKLAEGGFGVLTGLKYRAKVFFTDFIRDQYTNQKDPIPLKYYGHSGSTSVISESHSFDVSLAFMGFMSNLSFKEHHDHLVDLAQGLRNALDEERNEIGEKKYPNLVKWLDQEVYVQLLHKDEPTSVTTSKWTYTVGKLGSKVLDIPVGTKLALDQSRVIQMLKTSTTFFVMGLKVFSALRNGALITLTNLSQSTRSVVARIVGVPPEEFNPDGVATLSALAEFRKYMKAAVTGNMEHTKVYALAKKLN